jgi:hypothetical protein
VTRTALRPVTAFHLVTALYPTAPSNLVSVMCSVKDFHSIAAFESAITFRLTTASSLTAALISITAHDTGTAFVSPKTGWTSTSAAGGRYCSVTFSSYRSSGFKWNIRLTLASQMACEL